MLMRKLGDQFIAFYCSRDPDANADVQPLDLTPPRRIGIAGQHGLINDDLCHA